MARRGRYHIPRTGAVRWPAQSGQILEHLGFKPGSHLPDQGMPMRTFVALDRTADAFVSLQVWVTPVRDRSPGPGKSSAHRVMCCCPGCGRAISVGRLSQHVCKEGRTTGSPYQVSDDFADVTLPKPPHPRSESPIHNPYGSATD